MRYVCDGAPVIHRILRILFFLCIDEENNNLRNTFSRSVLSKCPNSAVFIQTAFCKGTNLVKSCNYYFILNCLVRGALFYVLRQLGEFTV